MRIRSEDDLPLQQPVLSGAAPLISREDEKEEQNEKKREILIFFP